MSIIPPSSTPPDSVKLFLHFLDSHFIQLTCPPSGGLDLLKAEARLALRFAILSADLVLVPAAYFFETPICREIILEHEALLGYGLIHLIGGGGNIVEYAGEKQEQYDEKSPIHRAYFEPLPSIYPPFINRIGSATGDISTWWDDFLSGPDFAMLFKGLKFKRPKDFERKWERVPDRLEHRAFIMDNVTRLLFKGDVPPVLLNRIQRKIDSWYFESFITEFDAGIVKDLSYFQASYPIRSNGFDLYYLCAVHRAQELGIYNSLVHAEPPALLELKRTVEWAVCLERCAPAIAGRRNSLNGQPADRPGLHLPPRPSSISSGMSLPAAPVPSESLPTAPETFAMAHEGQVDIVLLTALKLEQDAILKYLDEWQDVKTKGRIHQRGKIGPYDVVVMPLLGMGNIRAARAATEAIAIWNPAQIIMTGIAGGVRKKNERYLGDVLVAEQLVDYELGKAKPDGVVERRYQAYRPAKVLLDAAKSLPAESWAMKVDAPRPDGSTGRVVPKVHFGVIGSGQKVVTDPDLVEELQGDWIELIGLEMEGVGIALAAYESEQSPGFLLVKGVCDWADPEKNDDWQKYAAEASAVFTAALLRSEPFEPRRRKQAALKDAPQTYPGPVKYEVCRRLTDDWQDLADVFEIPPDVRARFGQGRGPQGVWEWLEKREKLRVLEIGLETIGRTDLVEVLKKASS